MPQIYNFLWLDLETTGLDERDGLILEIAAAVVHDGALGSFEVADSLETVINPGVPVADLPIDAYVREMHTRNGLLDALPSGMSIAQADDMFRQWVDTMCVTPSEKVVLAGGGVHFDQRWIKHHMPKLAERLHYRIFDVSTLKAAAMKWADVDLTQKGDRHRAMGDVLASIAEAKAFRDGMR